MAEATRSGFSLFFLVAAILFAASSAALADSDIPFVVAYKKASLTRLKSGVERVSVSIDLYNEGSSTAYDVSLNDDSWSQDKFELFSGNTSNTWEKIDAGSSVSHSFVLESKTKGVFHGSPAVIKFRIPTKAALQEAYSTPILPIDVLADRPPEKKFEWAKRLVAKYGALVSVLSFVGLFIYLIATPSRAAAKASKKKR
ncbi:translocon-associated protein subunit beta-like [Zingiber officinale]|uniref:translocon-associated protein subunit beta-like n=1 Tax=Zingiber officinale TaxID=94328 RepID=UPI001C4C5BC0|nr:translocon-associated protein subunit beta-like [Zingiber officinale]